MKARLTAEYKDNKHLRDFGYTEAIQIEFYDVSFVRNIMETLKLSIRKCAVNETYNELKEYIEAYEHVKGAYDAYIKATKKTKKETSDIEVTEHEAEVAPC